MTSFIELYVHEILIIWKNKTSLTTNKEVNTGDFITISENKLFTVLDHWSHLRANPSNKCHWFIIQIIDLIIDVFENEERNVMLEVLGKLLDE